MELELEIRCILCTDKWLCNLIVDATLVNKTMSKIEDRLFEEFLEKFKTIIAEDFPSLDGYDFEEPKLRRLFDHFLTIIIVANVGITPTIGQMLAVLKVDPEEEYELQGDEGFQRHLAYPLADAFRWAMEPLRRSEYAKTERAKPKEQKRRRVEEWQKIKPVEANVSLKSEVIAAPVIKIISAGRGDGSGITGGETEQVKRAKFERERQHILDNWEKYPGLHKFQVALILHVTDRTVRTYVKNGLLKTNAIGQVTTESIKALKQSGD